MTGSGIKPRDQTLLTDLDVDYAPFHCCGDEDLVFLRCPQCGHIWVECYECSTWYVDLNDLAHCQSSFLSDEDERVNCPACHKPFEEFFYLQEGIVDRYLPTAEQVVTAGLERFLARHRRSQERLLIVEDAFRIASRGVVLAPPLSLDQFRVPAEVQLRLKYPDGSLVAEPGHIWLEHVRLRDGGSRAHWVVVLPQSAETPPVGTEVFIATGGPPNDEKL